MMVLKNIVVVALTIVLVGCASQLSDRVIDRGVRIMQQRDAMILVVPSKILFNSKSANFTQAGSKTLDLILHLTHYYKKTTIAVQGFTAAASADVFDIALATERAHKVMQYLWRSGIDANFIYADATTGGLFTNCVVIELVGK